MRYDTMQREAHTDFASRYDHSPHVHENSMSTIAPVYAQSAFNNAGRNALIPSTVIDEPVVEHEHHHVHHHIDHGNVSAMSLTRRSERNYVHNDIEEDRRYSSSVSVVHRDDHGHHHHHRRRSPERSRGFSRSDIDLSVSGSRRGSVQLSGTSDWTIIDVPPGTRRITIDTTSQAPQQQQEEEISWSRYNGVRRSRGLSSELWTEITKDLVTREAIEDMGYQFEETDHFYYIFEYLNKEQVSELVRLTKDIRRERARELEYNSIAGSSREHKYHSSTRLIEPPQMQRPAYDDHPEIVYTEEQTRRRSRKYYY